MDDDQTAIRHRSGRAAGAKTRVGIDVNTGVVFGPKLDEFMSYLGIVSCERLSIFINSWDEVSEVDWNIIWEDVLVSFYIIIVTI